MRKVEVIGHRGARAYAPENTLPSYKVALMQGVDWVDVDVVTTKDKVLIGYHDLLISPDILCDTLDQFLTPTEEYLLQSKDNELLDSLLIKNLTFDELKKYQVKLNPKSTYSKWFPEQEQIHGVNLASLQEIIDYVDKVTDKIVNFQIEIKNNFDYPLWSHGVEELAQIVYDFILQNNLVNRVKIQAFDWRILVRLNELDSSIKTAYLESYFFPQNWQKWFVGSIIEKHAKRLNLFNAASLIPIIKELGGYSYEPEDHELSLENFTLAKSLGLKVYVWTWPEHSNSIFNHQLIVKLIMWGIDGFITDKPREFNAILQELGYPLPKQYLL